MKRNSLLRNLTLFFTLAAICFSGLNAQKTMTPDLLWQLGRVSPVGITKDGQNIVYRVTYPDMKNNTFSSKIHVLSIESGVEISVEDYTTLLTDPLVSPDGKHVLYENAVQLDTVLGKDKYSDLPLSTASVYNGLDYRNWDTWNDGSYNHLFYKKNENGAEGIDILKGEPYNCPQKPFGGSEDYTWDPTGSSILYVSKKVQGTAAATSTNTDLYVYHLPTGETQNLTANNPGYDTHPLYSSLGDLAWLRMQRDGYEADKNDIIVKSGKLTLNLTQFWDGTVEAFMWSEKGDRIYFVAPIDGTKQLFEVDFPGNAKRMPQVKQLTNGDFDVTSIIGFKDNKVVVTRTDMNHAAEIFSFDLKMKSWKQLTHVNDNVYSELSLSKVEKEYFETTDGKKMLTWVIYPPNFDPKKKYPMLLYCQGGPQSALTQFYSFRWNFQVMAAQGYIVIAPNRRGMQGHGVAWNEEISGDWGGQVMNDYLTSVDEMSKKPFVDTKRIGAVGASFGGYSVFYLAGMHENRFKTFISHCGVFNTESMYGTTEEVFFTNWDLGGPYWNKENEKSYTTFNPKNHVEKWNTPILVIQGGKDYRVPIGQGQEAFQAAQLQGIKSKFVYFPDENHWVIKPQNGLMWQREFFGWLKETL